MKNYYKKLFAIFIIFSLFSTALFARDSVHTINENWEFYLSKFITSNPQEKPDFLIDIPNSWQDYVETSSKSKYGYFSYRKVITGLDPNKEYAIFLAESPQNSCKFFQTRTQFFHICKLPLKRMNGILWQFHHFLKHCFCQAHHLTDALNHDDMRG